MRKRPRAYANTCAGDDACSVDGVYKVRCEGRGSGSGSITFVRKEIMSKTLLQAGADLGNGYTTVGGFNDAIEIYHLVKANGVAPLYGGNSQPEGATDSKDVLGLTQVSPGRWLAYFKEDQADNPPHVELPTNNAVLWCETTNGDGSFVNAMDAINVWAAGGMTAVQVLIDGTIATPSTPPVSNANLFGGGN